MEKKAPHYQVMMGSYTVGEFVNQIDKVTYTYNKKVWKSQGEGILIAPFQRTYQWHTKDHPLYLLDSLNQNIFVMPVILVEHKKQTWIIDGQQRLATLYCYIKGYQPKKDEPIKWEELITAIQNKDLNIVKPCEWTELEGRKFNKNEILNTPIGYSFLFNVNHEDDPALLVEIFDRINNQGIKLSIAETARSYGWLHPNMKTTITKIEENKYIKEIINLELEKKERVRCPNCKTISYEYILDKKIDQIFKIMADIYEYLNNNYRVVNILHNHQGFLPISATDFMKLCCTDNIVYNKFINILDWIINNLHILDLYKNNIRQLGIEIPLGSNLHCIISRYYKESDKFPSEQEIDIYFQAVILLLQDKDKLEKIKQERTGIYQSMYNIYKQVMEDE